MATRDETKAFAERIETEIGSESRQFFHKIMDQWRVIAAFAVAIVVFAAAYGGFGVYQERRLTQAEQALDQAVLGHQGAQRLAALKELQSALPKPLLPRYWLEMAKAAQEQEDWSSALEFWTKLAQGGPDHWSVLGRMGQASAMLRLGQTREALEELERLRGQAPESLLPVVLIQLAEAAEFAEEWERALAVYEELKAREDASRNGFLDFKMLRIRQQLLAQRS